MVDPALPISRIASIVRQKVVWLCVAVEDRGDTSVTAVVTSADAQRHIPLRTWYVFPHASLRCSASTALASRHLLYPALLTSTLIILIFDT